MNKKILISPSSFGQCGNAPIDLLLTNGFEIISNPYHRKLTEIEVIDLAIDCIGIIAGVEPLTSNVMDSLPLLKCISRVGVGMENVDLDHAAKKGIIVVNTPDGPTRAVAELTLAMTMALLRKIPQADSKIKNKIWEKEIGNLLIDKKIGVIGLGRIGKMVAEIFRSLGNNVIGTDPLIDQIWADKNRIMITDLDNLLKESDIITLHVPGNKDKTTIIGMNELEKCKKDAFIINISRGGVVDEASLYDALKSNRIKGAAIDVFNKEPYDGPLCSLSNVILTPHLGSYASEGKLQMEIDATKNLIKALGN